MSFMSLVKAILCLLHQNSRMQSELYAETPLINVTKNLLLFLVLLLLFSVLLPTGALALNINNDEINDMFSTQTVRT